MTVANIRLGYSPVMETVVWLTTAATGGRHPVFGDPGSLARNALGLPDVDLLTDLLALTGQYYIPDMLTPQPRPLPPEEVLDAQLADLAALPQELVAEQLRYVEEHWGSPVSTRVRRLADTGQLTRRLADGLGTFFRHALAEGWPGLRAVAEADLTDRARVLATQGVGGLLGTLSPLVSWNGEAVVLDKPWAAEVDVSGHGIVLSAQVLGWPKLSVQADVKSQIAVYYPAARIGLRGRRDPAELARVVGSTRAALLADLGEPRSTAELAVRHDLAAATVSYHLGALRKASLVTATRDGRFVLYQRSAQAEALLAAS
ncbi:DNA-binding transcriptional ArsR family regulator [Crossiella equi]|uniref:DNA-binding transcriptional ArsR family regulator n=1 Tax=Crossiella equi TaxID=130796 RepID=A0ABS5AID5_9PSEU|nr:DUF5937 family protein [Crossiella equi]MBP2476344.1 DNA-binding transcriptional ArsR family regulator [Crossiella equi]